MRGAIPPLPQYASMAWCLVKHRDNFTFYLPKHTFTVLKFKDNYTLQYTSSILPYSIPPQYLDLSFLSSFQGTRIKFKINMSVCSE